LLQKLLTAEEYHSFPFREGVGVGSFLYNQYGAPYIDGGPYFSISHCKHGIAVAVSETPIGIDIEHIRTAKPELVAHTMNQQEQTQIWESASPDVTFTALWTKKEAVLKMRGTGITSIDTIKNTLVALEHVDLQTKVNIDKQYAYTLASSL
jgi:4'-phosphopantetheinyl transferase